MAKIVVSRNQQREMERLHPKPAYSRVLTLELSVPAGIGAEDWNYTEKLGTDLWLLSVDMWVSSLTPGGLCGGFFQISTGFEKSPGSGDIVMEWESLFQHQGIKPYPAFKFVEKGHMRFTMMRFWNGQPRRFGAYIGNFSDTDQIFGVVAFEISEG